MPESKRRQPGREPTFRCSVVTRNLRRPEGSQFAWFAPSTRARGRINGSEPNTFAKAAGCAVGGAWSVDILETKRGWFVTDMAEAEKSFHWPECPYKGK
jgi:hypothetical protein